MAEDAPRLFLVSPVLEEATAFTPALQAALDAADVACVLLRLAARDEGDAKKIVRALAPLIQDKGAACLLADNPQLAIRTAADGVHIGTSGRDLAAALQQLKPNSIVGAGGLTTRDAAMEAGETAVDYLMFGGPDEVEPQASVLERLAWWAEIFNVPCVGYAPALGDIGPLVRAGADFIALGAAVWTDERGVALAMADVKAALAVEPVP